MKGSEMISKDRLLKTKRLVTHANCSDGLASAMIVKDVLPNIKIDFVYYNDEKHLSPDIHEGIIYCDFSPLEKDVPKLKEVGTIVLDHHKGTWPIIKELGGQREFFGHENSDPGVSGAVLAYRNIWQPLKDHSKIHEHKAEKFAELVGIRDTWQKTHPNWEEAQIYHEILSFFPIEHFLNREVKNNFINEIELGVGKVLLNNKKATERLLGASAFKFKVNPGSLDVAIFEDPMAAGLKYTSDVADYLREAENINVIIGYSYDIEKEIIKCSIRSDETFDCHEFCKAHNGGGHSKAGGFNLPISDLNPYVEISSVIKNWVKKLS